MHPQLPLNERFVGHTKFGSMEDIRCKVYVWNNIGFDSVIHRAREITSTTTPDNIGLNTGLLPPSPQIISAALICSTVQGPPGLTKDKDTCIFVNIDSCILIFLNIWQSLWIKNKVMRFWIGLRVPNECSKKFGYPNKKTVASIVIKNILRNWRLIYSLNSHLGWIT